MKSTESAGFPAASGALGASMAVGNADCPVPSRSRFIPGRIRRLVPDSPKRIDATWDQDTGEWLCGACEHNLFYSSDDPGEKACPDCGQLNAIEPFELPEIPDSPKSDS